MKKVFIWFLIFVALIVAAAAILPAVYKDDIAKIVQKEINKNVNARVDFREVNLSLFRSFPHFSLGLKDFTITGKDIFEYDTLLNVPDFRATIDLLSVVKKEPLQIIKVSVDNPRIKIVVLEDGSANYDITYPSEELAEDKGEPASDEVYLQLQKVTVSNANFIYDDESLPLYLEAKGLNHTLKGDLTQRSTLLNTFTASDNVLVTYDGVDYLKKAKAEVQANLNVDFEKMRFDFAENTIYINEIPLSAEGYFAMPDDAYTMDISFASENKTFKPLLSIIPAIYTQDYKSLETDGRLSLNGWVKGTYDEENMPGYHIALNVSEGMFKYPDLPSRVEDIAVEAVIDNASGVPDDVTVDVKNFSFLMSGSTFNARMLLKTPLSDPFIKSRMTGELDLAKIAGMYPLESGTELAGLVSMDANIEGNVSSLEQERYGEFKALGYVLLENIVYRDADNNVRINRGQFNLSPEYIDMASFSLEMEDSDINADGELKNVIAYLLDDGTLAGELNLQSQHLNLNRFMQPAGDEQEVDEDDEVLKAPVIPERIAFTLTTKVSNLLVDNMVMNDLEGVVEVKDQTLWLQKMTMSSLGGTTSLKGYYRYNGTGNPHMEMDFGLEEVSVNKSAVAFSAMSKYAPIAKKANGAITTSFDIKTDLDNNLNPLFETMNGKGALQGNSLSIGNVNTLNQLGDALKINELKQAVIKNIQLDFSIQQGSLFVQPFDMSLNGMKAALGGRTGLDQSIDYNLKLDIPRKKLGSDANKLLDNLAGKVKQLGVDYELGEVLNLNAKITGTLTNPKITPSLAEQQGDFKNDVKEQLQEKIDEGKEKAKEAIAEQIKKAEAKAEKLMEEARSQAEKVRREGRNAAEKLRKEADRRADQILEEAEGKGMLAKLAAEKAAEKAKESGYQKADKIEKEADKQADKIIEEATRKSNKLIEEAKNEAEGLLP